MTSRTENTLKRKQSAEEPEVVVSSDDDHSKSKARRVSTDASLVSTIASHQTTGESITANAASTTIATREASIEIIGAMIQDLSSSDNAKVDAAIVGLRLELSNNSEKCKSLVTAGGCHALVQIMKNYLDKAIAIIPAGDQVTDCKGHAVLRTLARTLCVIINLMLLHDERKLGIAAIGGVEAVVKVMKTFPKCQTLQELLHVLSYRTWHAVVLAR
jgi:hypothetical protein